MALWSNALTPATQAAFVASVRRRAVVGGGEVFFLQGS